MIVDTRWHDALLDYAAEDPGPAVSTAPAEPREPRRGTVYFICFRDRIKIGWSANPKRRLAGLPHDEVLGTVPGTLLDERRCHAIFASTRTVGEWFEDTTELRAFISEVCTT